MPVVHVEEGSRALSGPAPVIRVSLDVGLDRKGRRSPIETGRSAWCIDGHAGWLTRSYGLRSARVGRALGMGRSG